MKLFKKSILFLAFILFTHFAFAQVFQMNANASSLGGDCYRLTEALNTKAGSIWSPEKIDLNNSFDFSAKLFFGGNDVGHPGNFSSFPAGCGADGMVFALQQSGTAAGSTGDGIGYKGILGPSIGIEFDTYQNSPYDPPYDHIVIEKNGVVNHNIAANLLAGPIPASPTSGNIKDSLDHWVRTTWDASTHILSVYFDCQLRLSDTIDLVNDIFAGDPNVFWGYTSGTGLCNNFHRVCFKNFPTQVQIASNDSPVCLKDTIHLFAVDISDISYSWTGPNGFTSNEQNPVIPNVTDGNIGTYEVTIKDGNCALFSAETDVTKNIELNPIDTLPNVFTPNGDGINDVLKIKGNSTEYSVKIFDRWGVEMYKSTDNTIPWDGKYKGSKVTPGVYYYIMQYKSCSNPDSEKKGFITVLGS